MRCPSCRSLVDAGASVTLLRCKVCNTKFSEEDGLPDDAGAAAIGEVPAELSDPAAAADGTPAVASPTDPEALGLGIGMIPPDMVTDDVTVADEEPAAPPSTPAAAAAPAPAPPPPGAWGRRPAVPNTKSAPIAGPAAPTMPDVAAPEKAAPPVATPLDTWGDPAGSPAAKAPTPAKPAPGPVAAKAPVPPRGGRLAPTPPAGVSAPKPPSAVSPRAAATAPDVDVPATYTLSERSESNGPEPTKAPVVPVKPDRPPSAVSPRAAATAPDVDVAAKRSESNGPEPPKPPEVVPPKSDRPAPKVAGRAAATVPDVEALKAPVAEKEEPSGVFAGVKPSTPATALGAKAPSTAGVVPPTGSGLGEDTVADEVIASPKPAPPVAKSAKDVLEKMAIAKAAAAQKDAAEKARALTEASAKVESARLEREKAEAAKAAAAKVAEAAKAEAARVEAARVAAAKVAAAKVAAEKVEAAKVEAAKVEAAAKAAAAEAARVAAAAKAEAEKAAAAAKASAARPAPPKKAAPARPPNTPPKRPDDAVRGTLPPNRTPASAFIDDTVPEPKEAPQPKNLGKPASASLRVSPPPSPIERATGGGKVFTVEEDDDANENTVGDDEVSLAGKPVGVVAMAEEDEEAGVSTPGAVPIPGASPTAPRSPAARPLSASLAAPAPASRKNPPPRRPGDVFERTDPRQKMPELEAERKAAQRDSVFEKTEGKRSMPPLDDGAPSLFDPTADTMSGDTDPGAVPGERATATPLARPVVTAEAGDAVPVARSRAPLVIALLGAGSLIVVLLAIAAWKVVPMVLGGGGTAATPYAVASPTPDSAPTGVATAETTPEITPEITPEETATPEPTPTAVAIRPTPKPTPVVKKLTQQDLDFMLAKADVLAAEGKLADAKAMYLKIIAASPKWGPPHYGLANVYERQKDLPKACKEWRKFLELSPAGRGASNAAKKVSTCK